MIHEKEKKEPSESLTGTYEEIYSNWRNKVEEAAEQNNVFASFMNTCNLQYIRGNKCSVHAEFNITKEIFAFPIRAELGECGES